MENKINKKEENTEGKTEIKAEEMYRISISGAAEKVLAGLAVRVNDGFTGGRVNRSQITNWVLLKYAEGFSDVDVRDIRSKHFNEVAMLESILRQAKETGHVSLELRELLQKQLGMDESPKKRIKRGLTDNVIIDYIEPEGA